MNWLIRIASGILVAIALSQFPEFVQQYVQRMGGAVDALGPVVERFDATAASAGLSRQAALDRLAGNRDVLVVGHGAATAAAIERYEAVRQAYFALSSAGEFERLIVFARQFDLEVVERTAGDFRPAVPATVEGVAHAAAGFVLGYGLAALLIGAARALLLLRRRKALRA